MPSPERPNHETSKERVEHTAPAEQRPRDPRVRPGTQRALGGTAVHGAQQRDRGETERALGRLATRPREDRSR
jgi:hypothetical protein